MDGFAKAQPRVVRPGDRSPAAGTPEERQDVVVVLLGFEIEDQRRMALDPERRGREEGAVHALDGPLGENPPRGTAPGAAGVVLERIEEVLDSPCRREPPEEFGLPARQAEIARHGNRK